MPEPPEGVSALDRSKVAAKLRPMPTNVSAGLLMYRHRDGIIEVLLAHPGSPYWRNKDAGAWSIPKGLVEADEDLQGAAIREFTEETGVVPDTRALIPLRPVKQKAGKMVHAWAFAGDCDPQAIDSNAFVMEWPPRSGRMQAFPEVDRMQFFPLPEARDRINPAQAAFLDELEQRLSLDGRAESRAGGHA